MALVSNIAGFDSYEVPPYRVGQLSSEPIAQAGGLDTLGKQAQAFASLDLRKIFVNAGLALVAWVQHAVAFFNWLTSKGDYTSGQMILAERMVDQLPGMAVALADVGLLDKTIKDYVLSHPTTADVIPRTGANHLPTVAQNVFTILFGVRIVTAEDLDALDQGAAAYYARPGVNWKGMLDVPAVAVERAVNLKQTFYPASTYNVRQWDMTQFSKFPPVAPIPDVLNYGQLYNGPSFFGYDIKDGIVQFPEVTSTAAPGGTGTGTGENSLLIIGAVLLLGAAAWYYNENK